MYEIKTKVNNNIHVGQINCPIILSVLSRSKNDFSSSSKNENSFDELFFKFIIIIIDNIIIDVIQIVITILIMI